MNQKKPHMKTSFTIITLALLLFTSPGCLPSKKAQEQKERDIMDSWLKHHKSELIRSWGPPTRYESDGQGGEILIYETQRTMGSVVYNNYYQRTFVQYKEVFADKDGIIYYWRTGSR
jgi:hypothetical protein